MKKKIVLSLIVLGLVSTAAAFPVNMEVVDRTAAPSDPAVFNFTVQNNYNHMDRFRISSILSPPAASRWFDYEYSKEIEAGENETFRVTVTPNENAIQQNYAFEINFRSLNEEELVKKESYVSVNNRFDLSITSFQLSTTEVDPGQTLNISTTVKNTASSTLDDFRVKLSGFDQNRTETGTVLGSSDSIRYNFQMQIPEDEMPGNRTIKFAVYNEDSKQQHISQQVKVNEIRDLRKDTETTSKILTESQTVRMENLGNVEVTTKVNRTFPVYIDPLVSFTEEPDRIKGERTEQHYSWDVDLQPGETARIGYTINYVPALGFVLLLFVGIIGLKKLQTDVSFTKSSKLKDGEIKITLQIENNSGTTHRNMTVKDFIPDIAEVSQDFEFAKPVKTKTSSGTRLSWEIDQLQPGEQRLFSYTIKPLVEVEGGAVLPAAEISKEDAKLKESSQVEVEFSPE